MSDTRTPDEIERELEQDRGELKDTINSIQDTFSPDNIVRSITDNFRTHGGDVGKSVASAARDNPLALAVTGVGLAWLIFGQGPSADRIERGAQNTRRRLSSDDDDFDNDRRVAGAAPVARRRWTVGPDESHGARTGNTRSTAYGADAEAGIAASGPVPAGDGPAWLDDEDRGPSMRQRARASMHRTGDSMSRTGERVRDRSDRAYQKLSQGTQDMSDAARERIMAAREQAVLAEERAERAISRGADKAVDFFEDHPLVAGALAFAVGSALAGAMPRTKTEDDAFGAESDRMIDEAERIFHEERAKAERVAGAAIDEARAVGQEVKDDADRAARAAKDQADRETQGEGTAADAAVDRVEGAAQRITDAARDKAEDEDLGKPKT